MQCVNHPEVGAAERCEACADAFCTNCLVPISGNYYCGSCKVSTIQGMPALSGGASIRCQEAKESLSFAIGSLFCFGFILGPLAIHRSVIARKKLADNPRMTGSGQALAGLLLGISATILSILGFIARAG